MNYFFKTLLLILFLTLTFFLSHSHGFEKSTAELKGYHIPGAEIHLVNSKIVNQIYELSVALPPSYAENIEQKYPVIYVMDGQWNFSIVSSIVGKLIYDGMMPQSIVVGVTWGGEGDDANSLRVRDFIAKSKSGLSKSGGAENFLNSLEKELIPYIENNYRSNESRVITGSSLGGLFVSYALLEKPRLFNKYIASAPAYSFMSDEFVHRKIAKLSNDLEDNTRIFIGCGLLDQCAIRSKEFSKKLKVVKSNKLNVELYLAQDLGHAGVEPISYTYGLQHVFNPPFFEVNETVLSQYIGTYIGDDGYSIKIVTTKNGLLAHQSNNVDSHLIPLSNNMFYIRGRNVTVEMKPIESEQFSLIINARGNVIQLKPEK